MPWYVSNPGRKIEQRALKANVIPANELYGWRTGLEQADAGGIYFSSVNLMLFYGRKN